MGHDHRRSHFSGSLPSPPQGLWAHGGEAWFLPVRPSQWQLVPWQMSNPGFTCHWPIPYHHPTWMNFGGYTTRRWLYIPRRHKRIWICNGLSENRERRNPLVYHHFPFWKQPFGVYIDHFRTEPYVAMLPLMLKEPFGTMDGQYPFWITM